MKGSAAFGAVIKRFFFLFFVQDDINSLSIKNKLFY